MSDLREKAEKATRGEWFWDTANSVCSLRSKQNGGRVVVDIAYGGTQPSTVNIQNANAAYIAAANPQAVIALLDERDALAARLAELEAAAVWNTDMASGEKYALESGNPVLLKSKTKVAICTARSCLHQPWSTVPGAWSFANAIAWKTITPHEGG